MVRHVRVLYHYPCIDGVCAALAAHLGFRDQHDVGTGAELMVVQLSGYCRRPLRSALELQAPRVARYRPLHGADGGLPVRTVLSPFADIECRLDYCGPTDFIPEVAKHVKKVTLIDHHKTAVEILAALREKNQLPSNGTRQCGDCSSLTALSRNPPRDGVLRRQSRAQVLQSDHC